MLVLKREKPASPPKLPKEGEEPAGAKPVGPTPPDALTKEMAALQGTWKLVAVEQGGHKLSAEDFKKFGFGAELMVIESDKSPMIHEGKTYQGTIKVDPTRNPKTMDQIAPQGEPFQGEVCRSLYQLDGDTLTICTRMELGDRRPKAFTSKGMFAIYGFKREKK